MCTDTTTETPHARELRFSQWTRSQPATMLRKLQYIRSYIATVLNKTKYKTYFNYDCAAKISV